MVERPVHPLLLALDQKLRETPNDPKFCCGGSNDCLLGKLLSLVLSSSHQQSRPVAVSAVRAVPVAQPVQRTMLPPRQTPGRALGAPTDEDLIAELRCAMQRVGTMMEFVKQNDLWPSEISNVLSRANKPTKRLCEALGWKIETVDDETAYAIMMKKIEELGSMTRFARRYSCSVAGVSMMCSKKARVSKSIRIALGIKEKWTRVGPPPVYDYEVMTQPQEVMERALRDACKGFGGRVAFATKHGLSYGAVGNVLKGVTPVSLRIARAFGMTAFKDARTMEFEEFAKPKAAKPRDRYKPIQRKLAAQQSAHERNND